MKLHNILDYFSYFVLLLAFGIMIYYAYATFYPFEVIRFAHTDNNGNGIYKVETPVVERGGILLYKSEFEKLMQIQGDMNCFFEDGIVYQVNGKSNNNAVGPHDEIRAVDVPASLLPEVYRYGCRVTYKLTMGRTISYTFYTEPFEVR